MTKQTRKNTHYPQYHVLEQAEHWDPHTSEIVYDRIKYTYSPSFLAPSEVELLKQICMHLIDDKNEEILDYIIRHIDETLSSNIGENQREVGIPPGQELMREGLKFINSITKQYNYMQFIESNDNAQLAMLEQLNKGKLSSNDWTIKLQKALFKKILSLTVDAYYSHPLIWSEIGYGGPAYPRGYVRTEIGNLDPWEAQPKRK